MMIFFNHCHNILPMQVAPSKADMDEALSKADQDTDYKPKPIKRENTFGAIPGQFDIIIRIRQGWEVASLDAVVQFPST